jgi:hypothetical protein
MVARKQPCSTTLDSSSLRCELAEQRIHWIPRGGESPSSYKGVAIPHTLRARRELALLLLIRRIQRHSNKLMYLLFKTGKDAPATVYKVILGLKRL